MTTSGISRRELIWLTAGIILSLAIHGAFVLRGLADHDAARLGWQAVVWVQTGELPPWYTVRTSPLYLQGLKAAMDTGLPKQFLPDFMNWTSVLLGSLAIVPLYLLWRRQTGVAEAAMGLVICSFMPVLWVGNIHGTPNIPAFFFFCCGLLFFHEGLEKRGWAASAWFVVAFLLASAGIGLKADTSLCYGAFLWFAIRARPLKPWNIALALAVPVVGLLIAMIHTQRIASGFMSAREFTARMSPLSLKALMSLYNAAVPPMAMGIVLFVVVGLCMLYAIVKKKYMNILGLLLFWSAPPILFWCLTGNVARHLTAACYPVALLVAVVIVGECGKVRVWGPVIAAILAVNYFASPAFALPHTIRPSSRLLKARDAIQQRIDGWHRAGRFFADLPDNPKAIYGDQYTDVVYAAWEVVARAGSFTYEHGKYNVVNEDGSLQQVFIGMDLLDGRPVERVGADWSVWLLVGDGMPTKAGSAP
jgi:hypothetical protein